MSLATEIETRGVKQAKKDFEDFFYAFSKGKEDIKKLNEEMRKSAAPVYGARRSLMLLRTEWRMQHATMVESARAMMSISRIGSHITQMFTAYTMGQIRVERAQRDVAEATKTVAELQDRYNRYLEVFGKDSVFTQRALEDLTDAQNKQKEAMDALAKAQQDMIMGYIGIGLQAPVAIAGIIDVAFHISNVIKLIKGKGGFIAALKAAGISLGSLGTAFLAALPALMFIIPIVLAYTKDFEAAENAFHGWATTTEERGKDVIERMEEAREAIKEMRKEAESMGVGKPLAAGGGWTRGGQFGIPYVPETGLYLLHKGERVIRATERIETTTPKLINIRNVFYIGNVSSETDIEELSRRISEKTIEKLGEKW